MIGDLSPSRHCGRFAPSPTGPLHFGSLIAALGSRLEAYRLHGKWLVRMEDVDTPRNVPGADSAILRTLEALGFEWDGAVMYQSMRLDAYQAAFEALREGDDVFPCACSRKEIADSLLAPDGSRRYPGTCRNGLPEGGVTRAWRLRVRPGSIVFVDGIQGEQTEALSETIGDFVLLRADGIFAYQLAVVVDDAAQGVTNVLRGADLLASTARQIAVHHALSLPVPSYGHFPVAVNAKGEKLSKQTLARALDLFSATECLVEALRFLGQEPPACLTCARISEVWSWAREHWSLNRVPRVKAVVAPTHFG